MLRLSIEPVGLQEIQEGVNGAEIVVEWRRGWCGPDTSQTYLLFQTLLLLFWLHSCMIWMKLTRTDATFSRAASANLCCAGDTVRIVLSLLVGYPKWKVRYSVAANFPRWRYQGYRTSRTPRDTRRWQRRQKLLRARELTWTCTQKQITLLPTSTEELSIPPALLFTKDQR